MLKENYDFSFATVEHDPYEERELGGSSKHRHILLGVTEVLIRDFDCKSAQIDPKALAVPIVAMANADGGTLAIGISDKTRKIEGVDQYTEKLNELLRVPFDFCNPSVQVTCSYMPCTDKDRNHILLMGIPVVMANISAVSALTKAVFGR